MGGLSMTGVLLEPWFGPQALRGPGETPGQQPFAASTRPGGGLTQSRGHLCCWPACPSLILMSSSVLALLTGEGCGVCPAGGRLPLDCAFGYTLAVVSGRGISMSPLLFSNNPQSISNIQRMSLKADYNNGTNLVMNRNIALCSYLASSR